jgi:protease-4
MKMKGLYEKVGVEDQVVKSGKFKDTGSPGRDLTDEERAFLQETINDVHSQFVDAVFEGRKAVLEGREGQLTREEIAALADGRIFSGQQALDHKLIDQLGNLPDAIDVAAKLTGIEGKPKITRVERKPSLLERILGVTSGRNLDRLLNTSGISFRYELAFGE